MARSSTMYWPRDSTFCFSVGRISPLPIDLAFCVSPRFDRVTTSSKRHARNTPAENATVVEVCTLIWLCRPAWRLADHLLYDLESISGPPTAIQPGSKIRGQTLQPLCASSVKPLHS